MGVCLVVCGPGEYVFSAKYPFSSPDYLFDSPHSLSYSFPLPNHEPGVEHSVCKSGSYTQFCQAESVREEDARDIDCRCNYVVFGLVLQFLRAELSHFSILFK